MQLNRRLSEAEYTQAMMFAARKDNTEEYIELKDHEKFFGKTVTVVKGRKKELVGLVGEVVWLARIHYGSNPWFGFTTRVGIRLDNGQMIWTAVDNIALK